MQWKSRFWGESIIYSSFFLFIFHNFICMKLLLRCMRTARFVQVWICPIWKFHFYSWTFFSVALFYLYFLSLSLWWLFILSCWESAVIDEIGWLWNYARLFSSFHNCNNDNLLFFSLFHLVHKMIKVMSGKMRKVNIKLRSPEHEMELAWKMNRPNH